jgi:hypothetical protein
MGGGGTEGVVTITFKTLYRNDIQHFNAECYSDDVEGTEGLVIVNTITLIKITFSILMLSVILMSGRELRAL